MRGARGIKIAIAVLLAVAVAAGGYAGSYYYALLKASGKFDNLAAVFHGGPATEQGAPDSDPGPAEDHSRTMPGYADLHAQNNDLAGWLTIPGTAIDYPVMFTPEEPEYYLQRGFDKEYSVSGTPFIDGRCAVAPRSDNLVIHAHNMRDGSMFADLLRYAERDFWRDHPRLVFYAGGERQDYAVLAAFRTADYADRLEFCYEFITAGDEAAYEDFVAQAKRAALYETGVTAEPGDLLLTLSTCAYHTDDGRFVVLARAVGSAH